ncbi:MAG: hypothetical protein IKW98_10795 [Prevotella sp.]|nr:hypothetical protein [Prevotella sp.]
MKNKNIFLTAMLMALPSMLMAQKNIQKAFDQFLAEKEQIAVKPHHMLEKDPETGKKIAQCDVYDFAVDNKSLTSFAKELLEDIESAFELDKEAAYKLNSGESNEYAQYVNLTVGDGSQPGVAIGRIPNSRYVYSCFLDKDDPDKKNRYAYALEWAEEDGKINGRLAVTYGLMPQYQQHRGRITYNNLQIPNLWGGAIPSEEVELDYDTLFVDSLPDFNSIQIKALSTVWFTQFNGFSNLFRKQQSLTKEKGDAAATRYATEIYGLCKRADALDDHDKAMAVKELEKLRKRTKDEFVQELFDKSIELLRK